MSASVGRDPKPVTVTGENEGINFTYAKKQKQVQIFPD